MVLIYEVVAVVRININIIELYYSIQWLADYDADDAGGVNNLMMALMIMPISFPGIMIVSNSVIHLWSRVPYYYYYC